MLCSLPGFSVLGIFQARILEWVAMPSSRGSSQPRDWEGVLGLPHCRQILCHLSHERSPRILEGVAYPSSRGSSWPRNSTEVSWIAGGFFTSWATRGAHKWVDEVKWKSLSCVQLFSPWNPPGQNTGVGSLSLPRGIYLTQGSNPGLLGYKGILTSWATREAHKWMVSFTLKEKVLIAWSSIYNTKQSSILMF